MVGNIPPTHSSELVYYCRSGKFADEYTLIELEQFYSADNLSGGFRHLHSE